MAKKSRGKIFKDPDYSNTASVSASLNEMMYLDQQITQVYSRLSGLIDRGTIEEDIVIYGPAGTGKTTLARLAVEQLIMESRDCQINVSSYYINCERSRTKLEILKELIDTFEKEQGISGEKIDEFIDSHEKRLIKLFSQFHGHVILILDELEESDLIYYFMKLMEPFSNITVIGIINNIYFENINNIKPIILLPYDKKQLTDIATAKAEKLFQPGSYDNEIIQLCLKHDDAGEIIDLLLTSARIAENKNDEMIRPEHVCRAEKLLEQNVAIKSAENLSLHKKLILLSIFYSEQMYDEVRTSQINNIYYRLCMQMNESCRSLRFVSETLAQLYRLDIIDMKKKTSSRDQYIPYDIRIIAPKEVLEALLNDRDFRALKEMFDLEFS
ncbi:AAA ATPase [Methanosalsum zhilinae DSM 4017]|uniref:AAA ATPase n=1 Tax=Methanosalsum zhilinae (strain DSM 4017 / NBRC 107636 / OCM 62 / WeN5) TaxID=679901 RepID=F7XL70_METZD|nr:AAA family ATPase [Methanosalsum zhilinae]AEH60136.1 AAA ATPase [Methanosalsum zhilinae DSM 4017]